jgi:iron complex outermembrane recepter protein
LLVRSAQGSLTGSSVQTGGYILQTNTNVGAAKVSGFDLQANYKLPLFDPWGSLSFDLAGSALLSDTTTPLPGGHSYDGVGLYGPTCQSVNPQWRHNMRATWATPWDVELTALWRYKKGAARWPPRI